MNIFKVQTIVNLGPDGGLEQTGTNGDGECFRAENWADWPLVANSQLSGEFDWTFPDGVASVFEPDDWLMVQTHYVNASTQTTPDKGKANINFHTIPANEVQFELGTIMATKQGIRVCENNPTPTFEGTCQIFSSDPVTIVGANGHTHSRGSSFDIYKWDGVSLTTPPAADMFYTSTIWDEPAMKHSPDLSEQIPINGGVFYSCSYQWSTPPAAVGCTALNDYDSSKYMTAPDNLDCCYTLGPLVEKNETCTGFIYYYPRQDNVNCF